MSGICPIHADVTSGMSGRVVGGGLLDQCNQAPVTPCCEVESEETEIAQQNLMIARRQTKIAVLATTFLSFPPLNCTKEKKTFFFAITT